MRTNLRNQSEAAKTVAETARRLFSKSEKTNIYSLINDSLESDRKWKCPRLQSLPPTPLLPHAVRTAQEGGPNPGGSCVVSFVVSGCGFPWSLAAYLSSPPLLSAPRHTGSPASNHPRNHPQHRHPIWTYTHIYPLPIVDGRPPCAPLHLCPLFLLLERQGPHPLRPCVILTPR